MRSIALLLILLGAGSMVLHFLEREFTLLSWIGNWGEEVAWGIRGGLVVVGLLLFAVGGKSKAKAKKA